MIRRLVSVIQIIALAAFAVGCVNNPLSSEKDITAFSLVSPAVNLTINQGALTISGSVPSLTNRSALVAQFTTTGESVKVGSTVQVSGSTPNDFTNSVTYIVTAVDGSSKNYVVTVTGASLSLAGAVTTLAGSSAGYLDATGVAAQFATPYGIASDGTSLFVADSGNSTIRQIVIATGVVTTLAGTHGTTGTADGTGPAARFISPYGITTDKINLYVADLSARSIRQIVIATGVVTTLAGDGLQPAGAANGTGTDARFNSPWGITTDGTSLYVADFGNCEIRKIVIATAVVTTLAGNAAQAPGNVDGTGVNARFNSPTGITTDGSSLFVTDSAGYVVRRID